MEELLFLARADAGGLARDVGPVCLLEALMVLGSGSELTRLFTNLLENAVRLTLPAGTVTVSARVEARSVTVTVTDTGEGIAPEHLAFLGERFYRVDTARAAEKGSVGLGLAICRSIVQAHSGKMTIESNVGQGTTVRISLPRQRPKQRPQQ